MSALLAPAPVPSRWDRVRAPLVTIGGLGLATLALHLRDPHVGGSWGICPSAAMGFWCPGCGGLRAVNDLTHGEVASAASSRGRLGPAGSGRAVHAAAQHPGRPLAGPVSGA